MILSPLDKRRSIALSEAARVLGISARTLRRHAAEGAVPGAFRIGKRRSHWRFRTDLLECWFARQGGRIRSGIRLSSNVYDRSQTSNSIQA
jgi:excisionase family DNA binding protein